MDKEAIEKWSKMSDDERSQAIKDLIRTSLDKMLADNGIASVEVGQRWINKATPSRSGKIIKLFVGDLTNPMFDVMIEGEDNKQREIRTVEQLLMFYRYAGS
jgi:hypothetical protein